MCSFHMDKKVGENVSMLGDPEIQAEVRHDLQKLHLAPSEEIFEAARITFFAKYRAMASRVANMTQFLDYLEKQWFGILKGWYVGHLGPHSCTNNGLEATNGVLKRKG